MQYIFMFLVYLGMRRVLMLLFSVLSLHHICAQHKLPGYIDSVANARYRNVNIDTNYMTRPKRKWTLKVKSNLSGSEINTKSVLDGNRHKAVLKAEYRHTLSFSASYYGHSLSISVNPAHLKGKNNDFELNINSYGNKLGGDIVYQSAKTFAGTLDIDGEENEIARGKVSQKVVVGNMYYVFNHRHFSFPAAFTQSYIQKRSAGSFMLGLSLWGGEIKNAGDESLGIPAFNIKNIYVGIGGGYGYNLVVSDKWLFHLSSLPTFIVYDRRKMEVDGNSEKMGYHFPEVIITGRGAIVYRFSKFFTGISMTANFLNIGDPDKLEMSNSQFRLRAFFGINI